MRVSYNEMKKEFERVLIKYGITGNDAVLSAKLFADASLKEYILTDLIDSRNLSHQSRMDRSIFQAGDIS